MCKKQKYKLVLALGIGVARIFNGGGGEQTTNYMQ